MTERDLRDIEKVLGLRLPEEYRAVMVSDDARLADGYFGGLYNSAQQIITETLDLWELIASYGEPAPTSWVVVSTINGGDCIFLDTAEPAPPLRYWNHETMKIDPYVDSITRFVESVRSLKRE